MAPSCGPAKLLAPEHGQQYHHRNGKPEMTMKQIAILAALVLVIGIGGAVQAACIATNCAIDKQLATPPAQGGSTRTDGTMTPQLDKDLKELSNATVHAIEANHTAEPKVSAPPAEAEHKP